MHFWPFCMQLRPPISFLLLFGTKSSPEKVYHFLVSPNSIRIAPKGFVFSAPTESEVLLDWSRCTKTSTFLRDPPQPLKTEISALPTKQQTFYTMNIFLRPRGICFIFGSLGSMLSAIDHVQHIFQPLCMPQNGVFSLKIAHVAHALYFLTKAIFFLMVPRDLNAFWTFVHAAKTANQRFSAFWDYFKP